MLQVEYTSKFRRDLNLVKRRNKNIAFLHDVMKKMEYEKPLEQRLKDHALTGNWVGYRELHVEPDWLLIYKLIPPVKQRRMLPDQVGSRFY